MSNSLHVLQILMSDSQSPAQQAIVIKDKQDAQRKFGCPCGKRYLSYPALFTHVKQKHQGKPPGSLIKPKTDKARGRPRLPTNVQEDHSILSYDCLEELEKALFNKTINYTDTFKSSEGHETCQDMASQFLKLIQHDSEERKILTCFVNYLKFYVGKKYETNYWETHKPTDIIDISNEIVRSLEQYREIFPLEKETLINLLFILFRWMYKSKWTDHKLIRRPPEQQNNKENLKNAI